MDETIFFGKRKLGVVKKRTGVFDGRKDFAFFWEKKIRLFDGRLGVVEGRNNFAFQRLIFRETDQALSRNEATRRF